MIFFDSWVWIEFFSEGRRSQAAEKVIKRLESEKGLISTIVLMEVDYRIRKAFGDNEADNLIKLIKSFENLEIMPVVDEVSLYASKLRKKYYEKRNKEISYADAIHISTAVLAGCDIIYSGYPDFKNVDEIKTKII